MKVRVKMAKELPFFKFEPAEYLTKDISFCSLSAQGLFINICSYYWQRNCKLSKEQLLKRLNHIEELDELISEGAIDLIENNISIKFLDFQLREFDKESKKNSINGSKGGRPKKEIAINPEETQKEPNLNPDESQLEAKQKAEEKRREEKRKEEKKREEEKGNIPASPFSFYETLISYGGEKQLVSEWLKVRKTKKATNTETALRLFIKQVNLTNASVNEVLELCIEKSWSGYKAEWFEKEKKPIQKNNPLFGRQTEEVLKANLKGWE
jgi:hypothetical protein